MIAEQSLTDLVRLVRAEYRAVPGLKLTRAQMQRLWGIDGHRCDVMLDALVSAGYLRRNHRDAYVLASSDR